MRFIMMHKTNAHWEAGAVPTPEMIARVGTLMGEMARCQALLAGEGLRPSSEGVRLKFSAGTSTVIKGPFVGENELPAGFSILRAGSLDEAIDWASRQARVLGDVEIDIRPVTEPWDIGMGARPDHVVGRRYMALLKATPATERGVEPTPEQRAKLTRLNEETARSGVHLVTETMKPSVRGRRYKNSREGVIAIDGPFAESKEMIGGYAIVAAESLEQADQWARRYMSEVGPDEVDLRELDDPLPAA